MLINQVVKNNKWNIQKDTYLYASISLCEQYLFYSSASPFKHIATVLIFLQFSEEEFT